MPYCHLWVYRINEGDGIMMNVIRIKATDKSPWVYFSPAEGKFEMEGNSWPENARSFFESIQYMLREYFKNMGREAGSHEYRHHSIRFIFKFAYLNSSSTKYLSDLLALVGTFYMKGVDIKVYWYFEAGDEDMKEIGEELSEWINLPFKMLMIDK